MRRHSTFCADLQQQIGALRCSLWKPYLLSHAWYSGFARHKDPKLDAVGALADLLVFSLNLTGLDILQKIENQDNIW